MNKELSVGIYVRTKEGYICKILKLNEIYEDDGYLDHNDIRSASIQEKNVIKASHNIIDLIEVGDYVNGYSVKSHFGSNAVCLNINYQKHGIDQIVKEQDIKSIVTKEQFSAMEYRLGDK